METINSSTMIEQSTPNATMGTVLGAKDIDQAIKFYQTLDFRLDTALPGSDGQLTVAFLTFGASMLLLGGLDELHYEHKVRQE